MNALILTAILIVNLYGPEELYYDYRNGLPRVEYVSKETLARRYLGFKWDSLTPAQREFEAWNIESIYSPTLDTIYFSTETFPSFNIILHETIHFIQDQNGIQYACSRASEYIAYMLSEQWIRAMGHPGIFTEEEILKESKCEE